MPRNFAARACTPAQNPFRPELCHGRPIPMSAGAHAEIQRLKAELAKVRGELRDLSHATQQFVRSML